MTQGIIVTASCKELRSLSRWALKGNWGVAVLASVLSLLVTNVPPIILNAILGSEVWVNVADVYTILVTAPLMLGITMVYLNILRKKPTGPVEIFYGFEFLFKSVVLQILMGILIFLQTLLFVIPGLIAAYRYSLAFFILADDPRKGAMQCIRESKNLMMGNKMKMFQLTFSFFGWYLLAAIPISVVTALFPEDNWLLYEIVVLLSYVGICFVEPYVEVAMAAFYEIANGSLRVKRSNEYQGPGWDQNNGQNSDPYDAQSYDTSQNMGERLTAPQQEVAPSEPGEASEPGEE